MQAVKKRSIISSVAFLCALFISGGISAQYSPTFIGDSIKQEILIQHFQGLHRTTLIDASVNRKTMPIFCKWELDIQDYTKIPVKFRLGSQEVVDRLENIGPTTVKN